MNKLTKLLKFILKYELCFYIENLYNYEGGVKLAISPREKAGRIAIVVFW